MKRNPRDRIRSPLAGTLPQWLFGLLAVLLAGGCGNDFPDRSGGNEIRGRISYAGSAHRFQEEPTLGIYAFAVWPPQGPPHASRLYIQPDFDGTGLAYELKHLPGYDYVLFAHLIDLQEPAGSSPAASGGYRDYCSFESTWVNVDENRPTEDIDFTLYDQAGADDPCNADLEPQPGRATIAVQVLAPGLEYQAESTDRLRMAVFAQWPPTGPPMLFRELSGDSIQLPASLHANTLLPGQYAVSVCLDIGGTDFSCGGAEDYEAIYNSGEMVPFAEGDIIRMRMDLIAGTGERI